MGYPDEIPPLRGKAAEEFLQKLYSSRLTEEQKEFYREAFKRFSTECQPDCEGHFKIGQCIGCVRWPKQEDKYRKACD